VSHAYDPDCYRQAFVQLDDRPYWRQRDLAQLLQTSPSHVYRLIDSGARRSETSGSR
jgi:hypothetical protein